ELVLGVSQHIWDVTDSDHQYEPRLREAVEKIRALRKEFPWAGAATSNEIRHDGQLVIKKHKITGRHYWRAFFKSRSAASRYQKMLGGEWSSIKEMNTGQYHYYLIESWPSAITYLNDYGAKNSLIQEGLRLVRETARAVSEGRAQLGLDKCAMD